MTRRNRVQLLPDISSRPHHCRGSDFRAGIKPLVAASHAGAIAPQHVLGSHFDIEAWPWRNADEAELQRSRISGLELAQAPIRVDRRAYLDPVSVCNGIDE